MSTEPPHADPPHADPPPSESTEEIEKSFQRRQSPALLGRRLPMGRRTTMLLTGVLIGAAGGLGAVVYRWLIALCQDLAWGPGATPLSRIEAAPLVLALIVPPLGGLIVGLITHYMAPEAKGHGVPEVMDAVARHGGVIRPVVVLAKALASAVCIATGGSVGREGPIVQMGSAIGSTLARLLHLPTSAVRTSVACGAAAGIAGTFNAPIAGAFFAAEVILGHFNSIAFGAVVISSVTATAVSRAFLGDTPAFAIPGYSVLSPWEMVIYAVLGLFSALVAVAYIRGLAWFEDRFDALKSVPDIWQPAIGGVGIAIIGLALPQVMGVGYDTMLPMLDGQLGIGMLAVLLVAKLVATTFTLGSGGSGGVFAPSLFMGAAVGGLVGTIAAHVVNFPIAESGAYALVGMGAMVAAATHAPITAILIIFEMTGDYHVILGLMISSIIGSLVSQRISPESIYTIKLARRGVKLHAGQETNVLRQVHVREIMRRDMETVRQSATLRQLVQRMVESLHYEFFVVDATGCLVGIVSVDDLRHALPKVKADGDRLLANDLMAPNPIFVREDDTLDLVMRRIARRTYEEIPVLPEGTSMVPCGAIRRDDVIKAYNKQMLRTDLGGSLSQGMSEPTRDRMWEAVDGYFLGEVEVPTHLCGPTLAELKLRVRYDIEIILIDRGETAATQSGEHHRYGFPAGATVLEPGERLLIFGERTKVQRLLKRWQ